MPELLLELGTEELPATAVRRAYTELGERIGSQLVESRVLSAGSEPVLLGTPRRLIVSFSDVAARQEDSTKEQRGPGLKAAYDEARNPTPALLGFCRSQGVEPSELRNDGQYVWVTKNLPGVATSELLKEVLPKAIRAITFDKTMRWGTGRLRFARPIRWILAAFDGQLLPFELEGVESGLHSFGHRFYAPSRFSASTLEGLLNGLRKQMVEPDPKERERVILEQARRVSSGTPELPPELADENVFLTEWPAAIEGTFSEEFLELPSAVLVTAMAKHEKMFPVRDADGSLTNRFVFIRNSGQDESVRNGCEWVLNARFNDAKFFYDEDKRADLESFVLKTRGIVFQEKLGTVLDRTERLHRLIPHVAPQPVESIDEIGFAKQVAQFAKADLATGLVGELPSLQGIVGGDYARREGFPEPVCWAIETQYDLSKNPAPDTVASRTAVRLVVADQLDKLAGYLGIGLEPSGSSDPYALRRAASMLIEAAWSWPSPMPSYAETFEAALAGYDEVVALDRDKARESFRQLFVSRYPVLMPGVRYDILDAALRAEELQQVLNPQAVRFRVSVMQELSADIPFVQTATRPLNIVAAAEKKGASFGRQDPVAAIDPQKLDSESGLALFELARVQAARLSEDIGVKELIAALKLYEEPINRFFDDTMVMAEEPEKQFARLTLVKAISQQLLTAGDFSKLVIEGT